MAVSVNPLYAKAAEKLAARESGLDREKFTAVKLVNPGDKVIGKVLYVGDPFEKPNDFYENGDPEWKKFITTQRIVLEVDGEKRALWLNKDRMFAAIGDALAEAELSDLAVGHTLAFKFEKYGPRPAKGSPAMEFKAKIVGADLNKQ